MPPRQGALESAFGQALRAARGRAGLTQEELAHRAGLALNYMSELEGGRRNPSLQTLFKLADGLGIPPDKLVKRTRLGVER